MSRPRGGKDGGEAVNRSRRGGNHAKTLILVAAVLIVYAPAFSAGFIWDDDSYVTENDTLRSLDGLGRIWFEPGATPQYYPLVHTSFWIEYRLWGPDPTGYHVVNVILHLLNAFLIWRILSGLAVPGAWAAALLFALHPVHVESVAWITERKNLLSAAFYLAAFHQALRFAWAGYRGRAASGAQTATGAERATGSRAEPHPRKALTASFLLFAAALLSKTTAATLPAAVVLVLWWKEGRIPWRRLSWLVPMLALGAGMGLLTAWLETTQVGASGESWDLSWAQRILIAGRAVWFYAGKLVWPAPLIFIYPRWEVDPSQALQWIYPVAAVIAVSLLWSLRRRLGRGPLTGVLFFVGTLTPALGFFNVYPFRFSFVADHFQYLASLGLLVLIAAGGHRMLQTWNRAGSDTSRAPSRGWRPPAPISARAGAILVLAPALALGLVTNSRARDYRSLEILWTDTLEKDPNCWMARVNLGGILAQQGRTQEALEQYGQAVRIRPEYAEGRNNLGVALERTGRVDEAIEQYREALGIDPDNIGGRMNLANLWIARGEEELAAQAYREVLDRDPEQTTARMNLGALLRRQGRLEEAAEQFRALLDQDPSQGKAWVNLGVTLQQTGRLEEALQALQEGAARAPRDPMARVFLAGALHQAGRVFEAQQQLQRALALDPGNAPARQMLQALEAGLPRSGTGD